GNGFVGTHAAQQLVLRGAKVRCISRSGTMPVHLQKEDWAQAVEWQAGDAGHAEPEWFDDARAVVTLVGSPPLPTFSRSAYAHQLMMNSKPNCQAIEAARIAGVKKLVLMGAAIPRPLQTERFAYYAGKQRSQAAAEAFAQASPAHSAWVLQPSNMYGTRHSAGGLPIPLAPLMAPLAKILPAYFVAVNKVAACICDAILGDNAAANGLRVISQQQLQSYKADF
ncbi:MAG: NAD-dependent epimerase/dehydratase family protein, partial [Pseudomonadales bacterium]